MSTKPSMQLSAVASLPASGKFKRDFESEAVTNHPDYLWGQTTFSDSRVLASTLFEYLAAGQTIDDFLEDFPTNREKVVQLLNEMKEMMTP